MMNKNTYPYSFADKETAEKFRLAASKLNGCFNAYRNNCRVIVVESNSSNSSNSLKFQNCLESIAQAFNGMLDKI